MNCRSRNYGWLMLKKAKKNWILFCALPTYDKKAGIPLTIYKTLDRREALKEADFVTTQLRVGQLKQENWMKPFR